MSDFLLTAQPSRPGELASVLATFGLDGGAEVLEFHGPWGSLAVTASKYPGFAPLESEDHLCIVVGGPVLRFRDNGFLVGRDAHAGSRAILERWRSGEMTWDEDVSGPFVVLLLDRGSGAVTWVTDLLMCLPVYEHGTGGDVTLGTHVDAVAQAAGVTRRVDDASLVDFILHFSVTYPHTAFREIVQSCPASLHRLSGPGAAGQPRGRSVVEYWLPSETNPFRRLSDAARALHHAVSREIQEATVAMEQVAHFLSGGEDSRVVGGLMPDRLERDALVFLDEMNREGVIAQRVSHVQGSRLLPCFRRRHHYLTILPEASALIGSGHQYLHAHALGLHRTHGLTRYQAVFGGYAADSLYKGCYSLRPFLSQRHGFVPEVALRGETRTRSVQTDLFPDEILEEVTERRRTHFARVREFRPTSAHEWFGLWPMTMRAGVPNLWINRRLFRSYEPFLASDAVKVGAAVPIAWKLNRRLFRASFRDTLAKVRRVPHADGRFPHLPWWANSPIQFGVQVGRKIRNRLRIDGTHHGPWNDWETEYRSPEWQQTLRSLQGAGELSPAIAHGLEKGALVSDALDVYQKVTLAQVCHQLLRGPGS